ncbi:hypothetical protein BCR33DRAFT_677004 [Rhizoclosmatium globosum]|uniref:Uncharacterized protein n=1 Tax=Rhizoclosmatium globosum TaxID=329046 RepID=A0A1Y2CQY5_9FUNG|nr:hypothetical protein BCR33DRAFT_677004 [Rhizoclosmatium globosum]|eukprot:ORY49441.1 hypothetical protein BCR33DRAFT_677004 [Rhizoclosmatium globosum]
MAIPHNKAVIDLNPTNGLGDTIEAQSKEKKKFGKRDAKTALYHLAIWLPLTAFIIAVIIKGQGKPGYVFAIVVYVLITLRFLAQHISMSQLIYEPLGRAWNLTIGAGVNAVPEKFQLPIAGVVYLAILLAVACGSPITETGNIGQRLQSIAGIILMTALLYGFSNDRKNIPWGTVLSGFYIQYIIAIFILKTQIGVDIFWFLSNLITTFLEESTAGLEFVLGAKANNPFKYTFAVAVLPAILFFVSFISIVYYIGGMQYIVGKFAWIMVRLMGTSGAESVVAAASPFVGQGESALLVKPFVEFMTRSEIHSAMVSGFATISGSVLIAYINYTGNNPSSTSTLLASCLMSVPCSLLVSKIIYPETEESITKGTVKVPETDEKDANLLDAASKGAAIGVQLCLLITGSLLAIISLYQCANDIVAWAFNMVGIANWIDSSQPVSIQLLLSYIFWPVAVCLGIPVGDARKSAEFMATKLVVNEFVAYANLHDYAFQVNATADGSYPLNGAFPLRTVRLMSFALCGFANIGSIGIQTSILGVIAPSRRKDLAELALSAMLTGAFSTWISTAVAGAIL